MASVIPRTVGESLYWSYANLAMAATSARHEAPSYQKTDYIVRHKLYYGLLRGKLQLGSFLRDEKAKIAFSDACSYCDSSSDLTLDHLIPQFKGGEHSADNLVVACRSCNSSKKALDLLEWMAKRGEFPPLVLLRRYLKLAIHYCVENDLMNIRLECAGGGCPESPSLFDSIEDVDTISPPLPFAIKLIPHTFPDPVDLFEQMPADQDDTGSDLSSIVQDLDEETLDEQPGS